MKRTVIFPNNTVEVDGHEVQWSAEDFKKHGIDLVRIRKHVVLGGGAEIRRSGNAELMIFPTKEVAEFDVRANADPDDQPRRLKETIKRAPKRLGRRSPRRSETRAGVLWLECTGINGCHDMHPATEFYAAQRQKFGKMNVCKRRWDAYLKARKKNQSDTPKGHQP